MGHDGEEFTPMVLFLLFRAAVGVPSHFPYSTEAGRMTPQTRTPLGISFEQFRELPRDRATSLLRETGSDLLRFLRRGDAAVEAAEPARSHKLAVALEKYLVETLKASEVQAAHIRDRILIDGFLRSELDRDQNVYMGPFFTRVLTRAVPDVVFQPSTPHEVELAMQWARDSRVGLATRGAGSAAMGGAVPNNGGLLLEMSRFDQVQGDRADTVAVIGSGARLKTIHNRLAELGLALKTYPSNLGGTFAGWFSTGGLGLNSFKYGPVQEQVRAVSVILPRGEHVRFHDDGRLDVLDAESAKQRLTPEAAEAWLKSQGYPPLRLQDLAGTEGQFGILLTFTVDVIPLPRSRAVYFEFASEVEALHFVQWVSDTARARRCPPANLKYLSESHVAAARTVRNGVKTAGKPAVYIDFDDADEARQFEAGLESGKWKIKSDDVEALAWHDDRFRPQQAKRLGPGYLAAEILMATQHVERFLDRAAQLTAKVGVHLESEVYFFDEGRCLVIAGYMTQGQRRGFLFEMALAPMLVDLAMTRYDGFPYVLGRWQSPFFKSKYGSGGARTLRRMKKRADRRRTLNPGVFFAPAFRLPGVAGFYKVGFPMGLRLLRGLYSMPGLSQMFRSIIGNAPRQKLLAPATANGNETLIATPTMEDLAEQSEGCVNCGECNSVCPIFNDAGIRLPQMLTHIGEGLRSSDSIGSTQELLLDLCMRCGNCQEVCQADIPHLDLYAQMEAMAGDVVGERKERHAAILTQLRHSESYLRDFLKVRPGYYLNRTPASLPGEVRFVLFRAENDEGADVSCLHCGACVPVCPTNANAEYEVETDLRRITSDWSRCVGCGTCVEICPANQANGGQTLRVMEAPTRDFFEIAKQVEATQKPEGVGGTA